MIFVTASGNCLNRPGIVGEYADIVCQGFDATETETFIADAFADTLVTRADIDHSV